MQIQELNEKYGRVVLIGISVFVWSFMVYSLSFNGYLETWAPWHIPAKEPPFIDFRLIPSGAEAFRAGLDPAISNPTDPKQHIFNYPKIWYIFFYTGLTQADTIWISILLILLFFLTVFSFPEKLFVTDALLTLMIVFSPAAMLLYERGNVDLAFFSLCGLSVLLVLTYPTAAMAIVSLAAMFKFFPFFGVGIFLQENRNRFYKYFFISLLIFSVYLSISFESLKAAWNLTQRGTVMSYGVYVVFDLLYGYIRYYLLKAFSEAQVGSFVTWTPHLTALIYLLGMFFLGARTKNTLETDSPRNLTAFRMGALIYIGTFLLGNNWDYRLAFLIFAVPQISRWMFSSAIKVRWPVFVTFFCLVFTCWYMFISYYFFLVSDYNFVLQLKVFDEIVNWLLFGGLVYLVFVSAPDWFRNFEWFSFPKQKVEVK